MTTYIPSPELARAAMLVSLNIRAYAGKKEDKKVSREVASAKGATSDSGAYMKALVPKEHLEPITKAIGALRNFHYEYTLPWLDEGIRMLASQNYSEYKAQFETLRDGYDTAVRDFCVAWPDIVESAKRTRGDLFNPADYPADIASRFGLKLEFRPLADVNDFRVNLKDSEVERLREAIAADQERGQAAAMGDLYRRLESGVKAMAERLRAYQVDANTGKTSGVFRDSLVDNLRELCGLIPRMNFANDPDLEAIRVMVERDLCGESADVLRASDKTRERVAENAEAIAARLGEFMGDAA